MVARHTREDPMARTVTIYGIKNCGTMDKARAWLAAQGIEHRFHDYKTAGLDAALLRGWVKALGWEVLLNRAGMTWRKLPDADREGVDEAKAIALMLRQPGMVKRPVLDVDGHLLVGFKPESYAAALG
jgi:arsenate reductase